MMLGVKVADMSAISGFWYLGTPYTLYPEGQVKAWLHASRLAADLISNGVPVFSPIAHCHSIAHAGDLDPCDGALWQEVLEPFVSAAHGLIVGKLEGWRDSVGLAHELLQFRRMKKPIVYLDIE
jgi:hypothetical protein